jgi:anti-sigma B factor antagonist
MEISVHQMPDGIKKISLKGRMDIPGTEAIDLRLAAEMAAEKGFVVLDLTQVDFLASVGIGVLVRSAKALRRRGGEVVILSTVPVVTMVLEKTRIPEVVPMFGDWEGAREALLSRMQS